MNEIAHASSIDPAEVEQFARIADEWWDADGPFKPLHALNPVRLGFIRQETVRHFRRDRTSLRAAAGLTVLDIGCGGGLVCEPMARQGATVTGLDVTARNIEVARAHAEAMGLAIDYRAEPAETLAQRGARYDLVLALEVVEHVADVTAFLTTCHSLVKPGGLFIGSTLNRTAASFLTAIIGAEYVLGWLPRGTHDWRKFITPDDFEDALSAVGLRTIDRRGMVFDPLEQRFALSDDLSTNYLISATRAH